MKTTQQTDPTLLQAVLSAARRVDVGESVEKIYFDLQRQIDDRKPVCEASDACCHLDAYGHRLYVTTIELAAFLSGYENTRSSSLDPREPARPVRSGLSLTILDRPADSGQCIFQADRLCRVHEIRPFGCRIFFCDPSAEQWQQDAYEVFHTRLKHEHERLGVPYFYVEWREALELLNWMPSRVLIPHSEIRNSQSGRNQSNDFARDDPVGT